MANVLLLLSTVYVVFMTKVFLVLSTVQTILFLWQTSCCQLLSTVYVVFMTNEFLVLSVVQTIIIVFMAKRLVWS